MLFVIFGVNLHLLLLNQEEYQLLHYDHCRNRQALEEEVKDENLKQRGHFQDSGKYKNIEYIIYAYEKTRFGFSALTI